MKILWIAQAALLTATFSVAVSAPAFGSSLGASAEPGAKTIATGGGNVRYFDSNGRMLESQSPKASLRVAKSGADADALLRKTAGRDSELVCTLSSFFSVDPEQTFRSRAHLDGRGLLNCSNGQGFSTEVPVTAEVDAELPPTLNRSVEFSFSGNTNSFVIPREVSQLQDSYLVRSRFAGGNEAAQSPSLDSSSPQTILLRGLRHDLVIEMKLSSQSQLSGLKVTGFSLRFDDEAPDLN